MNKGSTVVYLGGSGVDSLTSGEQYTVLDYSDYRGQVKLEDDDGEWVWVEESCLKEV